MRLLAIGAHPDDVELLAGGTLAKYAAAGHQVSIAIATNGNVGSSTLSREETAAMRHAEAESACAVIGADLLWLDFEDEWLMNDRPTRARFIDCIREANPDIILAHDPVDYHPDHRIAGQVAADARIPAAVRLVETAYPSIEHIPALYTMDTLGGLDFSPDVYVDIEENIETKLEMLREHRSQATWLRDIFGMEYEEFARRQAASRGAQASLAFAEAFRIVRSFPPARPDLPTLGIVS